MDMNISTDINVDADDGMWLKEDTVLDGRYKIVKRVKAGGMGAVYQVADLNMDNRIMALKQMLDSFRDPQERRDSIDRFVSEIQVLNGICHPNIPRVTDNFVSDNSFFFVMDFIEGRDLSNILKHEGNPGLGIEYVTKVGIEVCEALKYIHNLEVPVAHRDIKPSNILVRDCDNRIMLID
ncbi:protein kinase, partial [bacterium]|nr:protein kinase [bacterium]